MQITAPWDAVTPPGAERRGRTPSVFDFISLSLLLKYSDKSCHRGGTTEEGGYGGWLAKGTCPGCWPVPEERCDDKLN